MRAGGLFPNFFGELYSEDFTRVERRAVELVEPLEYDVHGRQLGALARELRSLEEERAATVLGKRSLSEMRSGDGSDGDQST